MLPSTTGCGLEVLGAEQRLGHRHGVGGVTGGFRRRLAPLVAVAEERVLHVEVALVRRDLHRLAHAAAGEMNRRRHVRELDEVVQILERAVAPATLQVRTRTADRRRARTRWHHRRSARCARDCGRYSVELARRGLEQAPRQAARNVDALARDVRAGLPPQAQRLRIAPELDADLLEDGLGVGLDDLDRFASSAAPPARACAGCRDTWRRLPWRAPAGCRARGCAAASRSRSWHRPCRLSHRFPTLYLYANADGAGALAWRSSLIRSAVWRSVALC